MCFCISRITVFVGGFAVLWATSAVRLSCIEWQRDSGCAYHPWEYVEWCDYDPCIYYYVIHHYICLFINFISIQLGTNDTTATCSAPLHIYTSIEYCRITDVGIIHAKI